MSEERFIDHEADDFERALLSSARRDGMSPEKKRALALALAAGAATLTATSAGAAAAAAAGAGKAGTAAVVKTKGTLGMVALAKWIAGLAITSAAVVGAGKGAVHVYERQVASQAEAARGRASSKAAPSPVTTAPPQAMPSPAAPEVPEVPASPEAAVIAAAPEAPVPAAAAPAAPARLPPPAHVARVPAAPAHVAAAPAHVTSAPPHVAGAAPAVDPGPASGGALAASPRANAPPPVAPRSALSEELRAIDRARAAIAAGDLPEATRALDAHAAAFPSGALSDEARVLRIDILANKGDSKGAAAAARAFLAVRPRSPHAPRLRELLGETP